MFGIAVAQLGTLTDEEKARYRELYCGLCVALKDQSGSVSRVALSFELTFMAMLYDSLYEPPEERGKTRCIAHPAKAVPYSVTEFSSYAADLSVALAFHKCLDDVADEKPVAGCAGAAALARAYGRVRERLPEHVTVVSETMRTIREIESMHDAPPDATAKAFGRMLGFLFECVPGRCPDFWSEKLRRFGSALGRFVLLMDAAIDLDDDRKSGAYNPFLKTQPGLTPDEIRDILGVSIGDACREFERLPLVQDANLMRSILYSGVWQKFNQKYTQN